MPGQDASRDSSPGRLAWLDAAWELFIEGGINAVTIQGLSKRLHLSRSSFYHNFSDRDDLLQEMLQHWRKVWTTDLREDIEALRLAPAEALLALARMIRHRRASSYDVRVRAWGLVDPVAEEVVLQVDEERLAFIQGCFEELGFAPIDAECRARLFYYYELTEPAVLLQQEPETAEALLLHRHALLTGCGPTKPK
jgi:AcrR family transcriptional regulator